MLGPATPSAPSPQAAAPWLGRSIATNKLRLLEHSAYVEVQRDHDSYHKHLFVHIGGHTDYTDSLLEVKIPLTASTGRQVSTLLCSACGREADPGQVPGEK